MAGKTTPYVYGSAARELERAPIRREDLERRRQSRPKVQPRRKPKIDKVAVLLICVTFAAVMAAGILYLRLQFQSTYLNESVVNLQSEVVEMEKENAATVKEMDNSVDLEAIYERATKELGMVVAGEDQIETYESRKSTQIRKHGDIPTE